ncbi:9984_t:CDS:2, partial [Scutellospora calospora]
MENIKNYDRDEILTIYKENLKEDIKEIFAENLIKEQKDLIKKQENLIKKYKNDRKTTLKITKV